MKKLLLLLLLLPLTGCFMTTTCPSCPPTGAYYQIMLPWGPQWVFMSKGFLDPEEKEGRWLTQDEHDMLLKKKDVEKAPSKKEI